MPNGSPFDTLLGAQGETFILGRQSKPTAWKIMLDRGVDIFQRIDTKDAFAVTIACKRSKHVSRST